MDKQSRIQVLDRTYDYARHVTTSLFAVLNIATGAAIVRRHLQHGSSEFRRFRDHVEAAAPHYCLGRSKNQLTVLTDEFIP